jgi:hypothetical protein
MISFIVVIRHMRFNRNCNINRILGLKNQVLWFKKPPKWHVSKNPFGFLNQIDFNKSSTIGMIFLTNPRVVLLTNIFFKLVVKWYIMYMVILVPHVSSFAFCFVNQMGVWFIWLLINLVVWTYPCFVSHVSPNVRFCGFFFHYCVQNEL